MHLRYNVSPVFGDGRSGPAFLDQRSGVPSSLSCQAVLSPTLLPLLRELLCRDEDMMLNFGGGDDVVFGVVTEGVGVSREIFVQDTALRI